MEHQPVEQELAVLIRTGLRALADIATDGELPERRGRLQAAMQLVALAPGYDTLRSVLAVRPVVENVSGKDWCGRFEDAIREEAFGPIRPTFEASEKLSKVGGPYRRKDRSPGVYWLWKDQDRPDNTGGYIVTMSGNPGWWSEQTSWGFSCSFEECEQPQATTTIGIDVGNKDGSVTFVSIADAASPGTYDTMKATMDAADQAARDYSGAPKSIADVIAKENREAREAVKDPFGTILNSVDAVLESTGLDGFALRTPQGRHIACSDSLKTVKHDEVIAQLTTSNHRFARKLAKARASRDKLAAEYRTMRKEFIAAIRHEKSAHERELAAQCGAAMFSTNEAVTALDRERDNSARMRALINNLSCILEDAAPSSNGTEGWQADTLRDIIAERDSLRRECAELEAEAIAVDAALRASGGMVACNHKTLSLSQRAYALVVERDVALVAHDNVKSALYDIGAPKTIASDGKADLVEDVRAIGNWFSSARERAYESTKLLGAITDALVDIGAPGVVIDGKPDAPGAIRLLGKWFQSARDRELTLKRARDDAVGVIDEIHEVLTENQIPSGGIRMRMASAMQMLTEATAERDELRAATKPIIADAQADLAVKREGE